MFPTKTRSSRISNTVKFRHHCITVPSITHEDKIVNAITQLKNELASIPTPNKDNQLEALANLRTKFSKHSKEVLPSHISQDNKNEKEHSSTIDNNNKSPRVLRHSENIIGPSARVMLTS